jgi:hypothetical protein
VPPRSGHERAGQGATSGFCIASNGVTRPSWSLKASSGSARSVALGSERSVTIDVLPCHEHLGRVADFPCRARG